MKPTFTVLLVMTVLSFGLGAILLFDGFRKLFGGSSAPWIGTVCVLLALALVVVGRFIKPPRSD
jgi:hypothetical protein